MNTLPRLFMDPSWDMIRSLSTNELIELAMLGLMSIALIGIVGYGIYAALFRRKRDE